MENRNSLVKKVGGQSPKETFSTFITGAGVKAKINQMLAGKDGARFITGIVSAVSNNPMLVECDHATILSAGLIGESLKLSPSAQLGQYYLVPFNDNKNGRKVATFQIGYKGYIQLAIRSGQYRKINVIAVKEGELVKFDALNEEIEVNLIEDEEKRENAKTVGYYAMFEYVNGFRKAMYWSRKKMEAHALKYSKGYAAKKGYTFWEKDFDGMAYKTMLRQLISKWGIMSIDMERAIEKDQAAIGEDGKIEYVDNNVIDNAVEVKNDLNNERMQEDASGNFIATNNQEGVKEEFFNR
jgi:recombination protein RecT